VIVWVSLSLSLSLTETLMMYHDTSPSGTKSLISE